MKVADIQNLKPGTLLKISKSYRDFWNKEAYSLCTSGSGLDEADYFVRKAVGMGLPYKCMFLSYTPVEPGARVEIFLTPKLSFKTVLNYRDIKLVK